jgi:Ca2+-binding RTX toxin-like protein
MPTTFNWIYLGTGSLIDPTEGNSNAEDASLLVGQTYGSSGSPLYSHITQVTTINNGGAATALDMNNSASNDQFTTNIGSGSTTYTFDGLTVYNATITYSNGTTATVTAVLAQSTTGELFLAPDLDSGGDTAAYQLMPIVSIRLDSVDTSTNTNFAADRHYTGFDDGYVEGTGGNDLINGSYVEPVANGSDWIDNNDAGRAGQSGNDDYVRAGAGNDTVLAAAGNDSIYGGNGNDSLVGDAGNDTIFGEAGSDLLYGGDGADSLDGGAAADQLFGGVGDDTLIGGGAADTLDAGAGNDLLYGGDGADMLLFGSGDDTIYGDAGDDTIDDATGSMLDGTNLVYGGIGNDTVWTGNGQDTLYGDAGNDILNGEDGNDEIHGGTENDQLNGGNGNDLLFGDDGVDVLYGDAGTDILDGGAGVDSIYGGADQDTIYGGIGDVVDGGNSGTDQDVLDLTAWGFSLTNIYRDTLNPENGYVEFLDSFGAVIGTMTFTDIEQIIPCFTPGTLILTGRGEIAVEDLRVGDLVATRDGGLQPLRWIGRRDLNLAHLVVNPALCPVRIAAGALGPGMPARDMLVSPQHRMLVEGPRAEMLFGEAEVLVAAVHLVGQPGITQGLTPGVAYIHLMFDRHEILLSDGCWSESFQPAQRMMGAMDEACRDEILYLFPELAECDIAFPTARLTLKAHEARVLLAA